MKKRSSPYNLTDIIKMMEAAGWEHRIGTGGHTVLSKEGHKTFTLTDPPHRNGIAEIQRELGVHIRQLVDIRKGSSVNVAEIVRRVQHAQQLRKAGFEAAYIQRICSLDKLYRSGAFKISDLDHATAAEIANRVHATILAAKGVKVRREKPTPPPTPEEPAVPKKGDLDAIVDLLADITPRLEMLTRTDRISLLGTYLHKLQETLVDTTELKRLAEKQLEIVNRIVQRLGDN